MKRRTALRTLGALGGLSIFTVTGYKWYQWNRSPDLEYLKEQTNALASLVDTIIPATDSPGAREANVHQFILKMILDCTEVKAQNKFINGLKDLQGYSVATYTKSFEDCSKKIQVAILEHVEKNDSPLPGILGKAQNKFLGKSFFTTLKEYTSLGYFTSQEGATQALNYLYIPGRYSACHPYLPGEKSWATT